MASKRDESHKNLGGVKSTVITGSAQTLSPGGRGIYITATGNIIGQLSEDETDRTFSGLIAGGQYSLSFKTITSATATGFVLH